MSEKIFQQVGHRYLGYKYLDHKHLHLHLHHQGEYSDAITGLQQDGDIYLGALPWGRIEGIL